MRVAILADDLSSATEILVAVSAVTDVETFVVVCPSDGRGALRTLLRGLAVWLIRDRRPVVLKSVVTRRVIVLSSSFDHPSSVSRLRRSQFDLGLHKASVIYRQATIDAFRSGILNAHIGLLPGYRGRCVMEWSILNGDPTGVTVFFVDCGIDTGSPIVIRHEVDVRGSPSVQAAKARLFSLDADFYRRAIERLRRREPALEPNAGIGARYYVMSALFSSVVQRLLIDGDRG